MCCHFVFKEPFFIKDIEAKKYIRKNQKFLLLCSACTLFGKNQIGSHRLKINWLIATIFSVSYIFWDFRTEEISNTFICQNHTFPTYLPSSHDRRRLMFVGTTMPLVLAWIFVVLFRACTCSTSEPGGLCQASQPAVAHVWPSPFDWSSNACVSLGSGSDHLHHPLGCSLPFLPLSEQPHLYLQQKFQGGFRQVFKVDIKYHWCKRCKNQKSSSSFVLSILS